MIEESVVRPAPPLPREQPPANLAARHFHRAIDTTWRRTSYSGLIRAAETTPVSSEPEVVELDDEVAEIPLASSAAVGDDVPSPMADLPTGAKFGTLVHAVLETADPFAADLAAELETQIREHSVWWPVDVEAAELGGGDGADARHSLGPAGGRCDAAADRVAGPDAGDGLRIPLGGWRSARGRTGDPAAHSGRAAARRICRPTTRWRPTPTG